MATTVATGQRITADVLNGGFDHSACHLVQQNGSAQTGWTTATMTAVTFGAGSTIVDTDALHSESSNTSRIVIGGKLGWWQVSGIYVPATNASNTSTDTRTAIFKNGTAIFGSFNGQIVDNTKFCALVTPTIYVQAASATDYIELYGYMTTTSGTKGTATSNPYVASSLQATWIRFS